MEWYIFSQLETHLIPFPLPSLQMNIERAIGIHGAYFMYAGICAAGTVFIAAFVPETKGRTPEEIKGWVGRFQRRGNWLKQRRCKILRNYVGR